MFQNAKPSVSTLPVHALEPPTASAPISSLGWEGHRSSTTVDQMIFDLLFNAFIGLVDRLVGDIAAYCPRIGFGSFPNTTLRML